MLTARLARSLSATARGFDVTVSPAWTPDHDHALTSIGPPAGMSTDEVVELGKATDRDKLHVVAAHRDIPVLVTTLRRRQEHWEPASAAVVVGCPSAVHGHGHEALAYVGRDVVIPEVFELPSSYPRASATPFAVFGMALDGRHEAYWRSSKAWKDVRSTRSRTDQLEVVVNDPDALTWAIGRWRANWEQHPNDETGAVGDMEALWPKRLASGRLFVVGLRHHDRFVAANVNEVVAGVLYGLITARDPSWRNGSIGTRLIDETFIQATAAGIDRIDLGGFGSYKQRFAPVCDVRHTVMYRPPRPLGRCIDMSRRRVVR